MTNGYREYACPMHPEVRQAGPGSCVKCGMGLEPVEHSSVSTKSDWTCPMHPQIVRNGPGSCSICGMALESRTASHEEEEKRAFVSLARRFRAKSIFVGLGGAVGLFLFYFILLGLLSSSWQHPLDELFELKYWIGALILGFGIQIGMFYYVRKGMHLKGHGGKAAAAGTGTSTVAMVACCAHHLSDVLPAIGLAGVALFLSEYKVFFIAFGIISNVFGIIIMLRMIRKSAAAEKMSNREVIIK